VARISYSGTLKNLFWHDQFVIAYTQELKEDGDFANSIFLYKSRSDGQFLELFEGDSRLDFSKEDDKFAFDVEYATASKVNEQSTYVNIIFSPNLSKNNYLARYEVITAENEAGERIY